MGRRHDAALFHGVVQQGKRRRGAVGAADFQPHFLQNARHAVPHRRRRCQREIHDAKGRAQTAGRLGGHHLPHAGDLEGRLFHRFRHHVKGGALHALQGVVHNAGTADAHVDDAVRLAHAVEGAGHEGVILHGVAEHHQLGAAQALLLTGEVGGLLDDAAHASHGVHVDARFGRADIHAGADEIRFRQRLGDGAQQQLVAPRHPLLHQRGKAADEVHAAGLGRPIHSQGKGHQILRVAGTGHQRHGGDGDALIDDGDAELALDVVTRLHQMLGVAGDLVIDFIAAALGILTDAVQQGDAHGDGADVQMLLVDHIDGVENAA